MSLYHVKSAEGSITLCKLLKIQYFIDKPLKSAYNSNHIYGSETLRNFERRESDAKYLTEHQSLENYLTKADASNTYEPKLVSGTTIKTINNQSILGSGNILIEAGSTIDAYTKTESNQLFVLIETYNAKITELESRITALESSLGNVSTALDSINGEVIA